MFFFVFTLDSGESRNLCFCDPFHFRPKDVLVAFSLESRARRSKKALGTLYTLGIWRNCARSAQREFLEVFFTKQNCFLKTCSSHFFGPCLFSTICSNFSGGAFFHNLGSAMWWRV